MKEFGIDVSYAQSKGYPSLFDFEQAKREGAKFAILRASYGREKDAYFEEHYKAAKAAGLKVGAYVYALDLTPYEAYLTAKWVVQECLAGKQFELPIYYDVEEWDMLQLSREDLTKVVYSFCEEMEHNKYLCGVYSTRYVFENNMNGVHRRFTPWVAGWSSTIPVFSDGSYIPLWQFGGEVNLLRDTKVAGRVCDQNYMYTDFSAAIKNGGFNGYGEVPSDKEQDTLIATVKPGKIKIYMNPTAKTPQAVKQETGCDYVISGSLFHLNSWLLHRKFIPYCQLKVEGEVLVDDGYKYWGYAWNDASDFQMQVVPCEKKNYIACCVLIDPNGPVSKPNYSDEMGGERGRAGIGTMPNGDIVLYGSLDSGKGKITPEKLRDKMVSFGAKDFIMGDCGGSATLIAKDQVVYNQRPLPYYILIWEKNSSIISEEEKRQVIREWLENRLKELS